MANNDIMTPEEKGAGETAGRRLQQASEILVSAISWRILIELRNASASYFIRRGFVLDLRGRTDCAYMVNSERARWLYMRLKLSDEESPSTGATTESTKITVAEA